MCIAVERFSQYIRNVQIRRNVRRKYKTFANGVANPMITDFDVFRALINRVVEIDQSDGALVVNTKVNGVGVVDEVEFAK